MVNNRGRFGGWFGLQLKNGTHLLTRNGILGRHLCENVLEVAERAKMAVSKFFVPQARTFGGKYKLLPRSPASSNDVVPVRGCIIDEPWKGLQE